MTELKEDSLKFILMFMEAEPSDELLSEIENYKKTKTMKVVKDQRERFDFDSFDFEQMSLKLRKHIPALSDGQLAHAIAMCKLKKNQITSQSQLIQVIIDHL